MRSRTPGSGFLKHCGATVAVTECMYFLSSSLLVGHQRENYKTVLLSFCNESVGKEKSEMAESAKCQSPIRLHCSSSPPVRLALTQYNVTLLDHPRVLGILGVWSPRLHHPLHLGKRRTTGTPGQPVCTLLSHPPAPLLLTLSMTAVSLPVAINLARSESMNSFLTPKSLAMLSSVNDLYDSSS